MTTRRVTEELREADENTRQSDPSSMGSLGLRLLCDHLRFAPKSVHFRFAPTRLARGGDQICVSAFNNPGLHDLALSLPGPGGLASAQAARLAEAYPTCGLAEFFIALPWHQLEAGGGRLVRFLLPADLPETAT